MADTIDLAQELTEHMNERALATARANIPPFTGKCATCLEPISKGRFCGRECRDDFEQGTGTGK